MSGDNVGAAREMIEAWNRGDVEALIELSTDDIEFTPAMAATVEGRSIRGPEEFRRFFEEWKSTFETFRIEPREFHEAGDVVVALSWVHAKGRGSGLELDQPIALTYHFRDGRVDRAQSFLDHEEALAAAGAGEKEKA